MKWWIYLLLICLVTATVLAKEGRRKDRGRSRTKRINRDKELSRPVEGGDDDDDDDAQEDQPEQRVTNNPCNIKKCGRGETCVLEDGEAICLCVPDCNDDVPDPRYRACSTRNTTYYSECHLDRDHCLCKNKQPTCSVKDEEGPIKIRLDYFGECKEISECPQNELDQFANRTREWLFVVMKEIAARDELGEYIEMLESAGLDEKHTDAIIWKFCDLDILPRDRRVTRRELLYIISSLKPMEHCLVPFLSKCDTNNDNNIDLIEWGSCLGLDHQHIQDKCKGIHQKSKQG